MLMYICGIQKNGTDERICQAGLETQMQKTGVDVGGGSLKKNNVNELVCQEGDSVKALSPSWDSETGWQENESGNAAKLITVP